MANKTGKGGFQKGQSGNPGGRKSKVPPELQALCREHTAEAIHTILTWMKSDQGSVAIAAAKEILERGWGKAPQPVTGENGGPLVVQVLRFADADDPGS